jgi:hypothetical protein
MPKPSPFTDAPAFAGFISGLVDEDTFDLD